MKDKERIPKILKELEEIWNKNPDLRLVQLITNLSNDIYGDLYYVEDEMLIKNLKEYYG